MRRAFVAAVTVLTSCGPALAPRPAPRSAPPAPASAPSPVEPAPVVAMPAPASRPVDPSCPGCRRELALEACTRCGGLWDVGLLGLGHCACPTPDGGRVCGASRECAHRCEIPWEVALGYRDVRCTRAGCRGPRGTPARPLTLGRCATQRKTFGCHGWLVETPGPGGPGREARVMCVD